MTRSTDDTNLLRAPEIINGVAMMLSHLIVLHGQYSACLHVPAHTIYSTRCAAQRLGSSYTFITQYTKGDLAVISFTWFTLLPPDKQTCSVSGDGDGVI